MIGSMTNRHNQGGRLLGLPILVGTLIFALAACEGPAGVDGQDGRDGLNGQDGTDGRDGTDGEDGNDGNNGSKGDKGDKGDTGDQGPAGPGTYRPAPGVTLEIAGAELTPERKVAITWKIVDQNGNPIDREGKLTEGAYAPSFVVAYFDTAADQFRSLKTRTETDGENTVVQATNDSGGTTKNITLGTYEYVTGLTVPAELPASTILRVHGFASRTYEGVAYVGADVYDFALDGSTPTVRQIVTDAACDTCHGALTAHGRRRGVDGCITCHTFQSTDAQTGNTVDMATMVHKIHTGVNLPSVQEGQVGAFYGISGYQNHMYYYAQKTADGVVGVNYLRDTRQCDACHGGAANGDRAFTTITTAACSSCHDGASALAHMNGKPADSCAYCHAVGADEGVDVVHRTNREWADDEGITGGLETTIVSVTGVAAGGSPTVRFTARYADGRALDLPGMYGLRAVFAGPMPIPTWTLTGQDLRAATGPDAEGVYTATVTGTLPETGAAGETVMVYIEARVRHQNQVRDGETLTITEVATNPVAYVVAGTDAVGAPRAMDAPMASCVSCHGQIGNSATLSGHGGQRNTMEACVTCHNPTLAEGDMPVMVHKIHAGEHLTQGYEIGGDDFSHVVFTRPLNDCRSCHAGNGWQDPSTRTCITCHDSPAAAAHAELNTTASGVEACAVCHGAGSTLGADKVHAKLP